MKSTHSPVYIEAGYIHDKTEGKGTKSVTFSADIPQDGEYEVRVSYTPGSNRSRKTPVRVHHKDGETRRTIDQKKAPPIMDAFISMGRFSLKKGRQKVVTISNEDTNDGVVIADAVQILASTDVEKQVVKKETKPAPEKKPGKKPGKKPDTTLLKKEIARLKKAITEHKKKAPKAADVAMSVKDEEKPADWHLHIRGGIRNLGDLVPRGFITVVDQGNQKPAIAEMQSGRMELADWIADPDNPLTARVYVNRIWHHLFGAGLVRTIDNFGKTGESPSHPELLDYLARDFITGGWSTKKMIRRLMLSHTYRLSSDPHRDTGRTDPENRLLSRFNRRSLDAESLRDTMLAVSGQLDLTTGGLTIRKFSQYDNGYVHDKFFRRSIYVPVFRNAILELFTVFDFPNPNLVSGRRVSTILPTQSLYLLNSPFVSEQAKRAAEKLLAAPQLDPQTQLNISYRKSLGRLPTKEESHLALDFIKAYDDNKQQAWAGIYHGLFASLNFRYLD